MNRTEVVEAICLRLEDGETLRAICREDGMPSYGAVYDWIEKDPEIASRFERARARGADAIAEQAMAIADDRSDDPASRRVRVETRLKLLAKWHPKRYGDKLELGGSKDSPLTVEIVKLGDK